MTINDNSDIQAKIKDIEERVKAARPKETIQKQIEQKSQETTYDGSRIGSEFLASVIAGGLLGFGIDWAISTKPWGMIFFILMGFISGVYRANAAMKKNSEENNK